MSPATTTATQPMTLAAGIIRMGEESQLAVDTEAGRLPVIRAASCLVDPQPGDEVLFADNEDGAGYVLAVLRQADPSRTTLVLRGEVALRLPEGSLRLEAERMSLAAGTMDWSAGRLTQRVRTCFRWVEEVEQVTVGRLRYFIGEVFDLMGGQVQIKADRKVRIDGETIHFG